VKFNKAIKISSNGRYIVMYSNSYPWIYYSSNYGTTFSIIGPQIIGTCAACAISDNGQYVAFVAYGGPTNGFYLSTDSGNSFTVISNSGIGLPSNYSYYDVQMSATGQYMVTCIPNYGLYSTNYGASWTQINTPNGNNNVGISGSGQYMYVAQNSALYYSTDYGTTWNTKFNFNIFPSCIVSSSNGNIFAIASNSSGLKGLSVFKNGPTNTYTQYFTTQYIVDTAMSNDGLVILVLILNSNGTSTTLYYSIDSGNSWITSTNLDSTQNWEAISISGDKTLVVAVTNNGGTEYQSISNFS
jgi:photosystem II stability/assembly factor-like uncharacterized protein